MVAVVGAGCAGDPLAAKERRVAHHRIETRCPDSVEDLGERDWPVQRHSGRCTVGTSAVQAHMCTCPGRVERCSLFWGAESRYNLDDHWCVGFEEARECRGGVFVPGGCECCAGEDIGDHGERLKVLLASAVEVLFTFDVGGSDGLDAVHLMSQGDCFFDEALDGFDGFSSGLEAWDRCGPCSSGGGVEVQVSELVEVVDAEQAVA